MTSMSTRRRPRTSRKPSAVQPAQPSSESIVEHLGVWGEQYPDGRWNCYSGGELVRHRTRLAAAKACAEYREWECCLRLKPARIPVGKLREACEFERQLLAIRTFVSRGCPKQALLVIDAVLKRNGWGVGL